MRKRGRNPTSKESSGLREKAKGGLPDGALALFNNLGLGRSLWIFPWQQPVGDREISLDPSMAATRGKPERQGITTGSLSFAYNFKARKPFGKAGGMLNKLREDVGFPNGSDNCDQGSDFESNKALILCIAGGKDGRQPAFVRVIKTEMTSQERRSMSSRKDIQTSDQRLQSPQRRMMNLKTGREEKTRKMARAKIINHFPSNSLAN